MVFKVDQGTTSYSKEGLKAIHDDIDKMISGPAGSYINEYYFPPHLVTDYLTSSWGLEYPEFHGINLREKSISMIFRSTLRLSVIMTMRWDTGFRRGFRLTRIGR